MEKYLIKISHVYNLQLIVKVHDIGENKTPMNRTLCAGIDAWFYKFVGDPLMETTKLHKKSIDYDKHAINLLRSKTLSVCLERKP